SHRSSRDHQVGSRAARARHGGEAAQAQSRLREVNSFPAGGSVRIPTRSVLTLTFATLCLAKQSPVPVEQEPFHQLVFQNAFVEVMRVTLPPGKSTQFHTHGHDGIAVQVSNATITQQKPGEAETPKSQGKPGDVSARTVDTPYTHRVINQGATPFEVIDV